MDSIQKCYFVFGHRRKKKKIPIHFRYPVPNLTKADFAEIFECHIEEIELWDEKAEVGS